MKITILAICIVLTMFGSDNNTFLSETINSLPKNTTDYVSVYLANSNVSAYGNQEQFTTQSSGFLALFPGETITVTGNTFSMGSNGYKDEQPIHSVRLSDFSISKYEITNAQYALYMNAIGASNNGSVNGTEYLDMDDIHVQIKFTGGRFIVTKGKENYPVIEVSWYGAKAYSEYYGGRLPTEAEWEFASRGGNRSKDCTYAGSNTIDDVTWYEGNTSGPLPRTHAIGTKKANELGLYDMSGNVWEWTNDWYDKSYYRSSPTNSPQGPLSGTRRVIRGGDWRDAANYCRVAFRYYNGPENTGYALGFRLVFVP